jgi:hypothetical protein
MNKRDIFSELTESFAALQDERAGKLTLRRVQMAFRQRLRFRPVAPPKRFI